MNERQNLGIDFGTSNSSVGVMRDGKARILEIEKGKQSQPSSIFIRADGYHSIGFGALSDFTNPEAKTDTYHFVPSIKPALPLDYYEGILLKSTKRDLEGNLSVKFFGVEEMAAYVISNLKQKAEAELGTPIEKVVLGRPVEFAEDSKRDSLAQGRLEEAAKLVGFKSIQFILEPVAAALYYERSRPNTKSRNVFIFDFGGGTLDTCILELKASGKITQNSLNSQVLSSHGIVLGGNDLDKDVFEKRYLSFFGKNVQWSDKRLPMPAHIFNEVPEWHLIDQLRKRDMFGFLREVTANCTDPEAINRLTTLIQDQQVFAVLQTIERGKIALSASDEANIKYEFKDIHLNDSISRREFESMVSSRGTDIQKCIDECLIKAQLRADQIDAVLKVGGSSNNKFIDKILAANFQTQIENDDVFTSVVAGLSIAASEIFE